MGPVPQPAVLVSAEVHARCRPEEEREGDDYPQPLDPCRPTAEHFPRCRDRRRPGGQKSKQENPSRGETGAAAQIKVQQAHAQEGQHGKKADPGGATRDVRRGAAQRSVTRVV